MRDRKELLYPKDRSFPVKRRSFLTALGWGGLLASLAIALGGLVRFAFPNVLFEPPSRIRLGKPEDYPPGSIRFLAKERLFVLRETAGIRVMSAICTHLGCTVRPFVKADDEFARKHSHCPCHGSVFAQDGRVLVGPALRPLESHPVRLLPNGRLEVDKRRKVAADWHLRV
ncbi:MAG: ubiquinol-cytochrome c reductase iron-sulfur subunit [Thermodesulfobacteriota bacterium]